MLGGIGKLVQEMPHPRQEVKAQELAQVGGLILRKPRHKGKHEPDMILRRFLVSGSRNAVFTHPCAQFKGGRTEHHALAIGVYRAPRRRRLCARADEQTANAVVYIVQGRLLGGVANSVVAAAGLVPHYRAMLLTFALMCFAGCVLAALTMHAVSRETVAHGGGGLAFSKRVFARMAVACLLVFAGIFVMRFAFYMMHLTVVIAV